MAGGMGKEKSRTAFFHVLGLFEPLIALMATGVEHCGVSLLSGSLGNQANESPGNALSLSHHLLQVAFTALEACWTKPSSPPQLSLIILFECIVVPGVEKNHCIWASLRSILAFLLSLIFYLKKCLVFLSRSGIAELKVELMPIPLSRRVSDRFDCGAAGYPTLTEWSFTHFATAQLVFPAYTVLSSFYTLLQG